MIRQTRMAGATVVVGTVVEVSDSLGRRLISSNKAEAAAEGVQVEAASVEPETSDPPKPRRRRAVAASS